VSGELNQPKGSFTKKGGSMVAPLIASAVVSIGSYLAKNGLDVLAGVFRGAVDKGTEKVAELIEEKTGIDINNAAESQGLSQEDLIKLKDFELQYQAQLLKHSEAVEQLRLNRDIAYLADAQNARGMQTAAMTSADPYVRRFVYGYALLLTLLSFGFLYVVLFNGHLLKADGNKDLVNTIVGFLLGTTLSTVIGFFYGSSKGSSDKNEQISALSSQLSVAVASKNVATE